MITIYHKNNRIVKVISDENKEFPFDEKENIAAGLVQLAQQFPNSILVWCNEDFAAFLDLNTIKAIFHHDKIMISYNPSDENYLGAAIGYIEDSPFIKINKIVAFSTWQMSSAVGAIHASVLIAVKDKITIDSDFDYYLNSVAKLAMSFGLLCYSEPQLLRQNSIVTSTKKNTYSLFRFVKQHYKMRWVFLLLLEVLIYERKFPFSPFLLSLFYKKRTNIKLDLDSIKVQSSRKVVDKATMDVIIPTIGRKNYLYDVLKDFSKQTLLPQKIIIVEQNPLEGSSSELDYLTNEKWPFEIQHFFTHQAGACNARNLALNETQSEWVFLADDDIRIESDFIQKAFEKINDFGIQAASFSCFEKGRKSNFKAVFQWETFGSGSSFVLAESLKNCKFRLGYEFGYGEDVDFGMQLRNQGVDILFLPEPSILHLKAPIGGFRTKPTLQWQDDSVQPKPSPTIMLYQLTHKTLEQIRGYKTILFMKYYKHQKIKNPVQYCFNFQKQWEKSVFWANKLQQQHEV